MDFQLLIEELNTHNLPKGQFAISSSGVLAVRGIREANDIDLVAASSLWNTLSQKHPVVKNANRPLIQLSQNISVLGDAWIEGFDLYTNDQLIQMSENINGINYVPLETIAIMKKRSGREKDLKDIDLIQDYLNK